MGRARVAGALRVGCRCVVGGWLVDLGGIRSWQMQMAMPAAEQKKDFASEGLLGPERSGECLSFARQRRNFSLEKLEGKSHFF